MPERSQRALFRRLLAAERGRIAAGAALLVLSQLATLVVPRLLGAATDALVASDRARAAAAAASMALVAAAGGLTRVASRLVLAESGRRAARGLGAALFAKLLTLSAEDHARSSIGDRIARTRDDLDLVRGLFGSGLASLAQAALLFPIVTPLLLSVEPTLALLALLPVPVLIGLGRLVGRRMFRRGRELQDRLAALSASLHEELTGALTVRTCRGEGPRHAKLDRLDAELDQARGALLRLRGVLFPTVGLAASLGFLAVFGFGGLAVIEGRLTLGQFAEFNAYLALLVPPTIGFGWTLSSLQRGRAALARIAEVLDATPSLPDVPARAGPLTPSLETTGFILLPEAAGSPVRLSAAPGKRIVVVGPTGAGKSRLLRALARLTPVPRGAIALGGCDVVDLSLGEVRRSVGYAPQEALLFARSIFENVAWGRPEATEAEVREVLRIAGLDVDDPHQFPDGLHTFVGEGGARLSGGQRQRVALARALLPRAPILLLDDPLSAVDAKTEAEVLGRLATLWPERPPTIVLATHRLAAARLADEVLVLDRGAIVERGREPALLALGGAYARLHRRERLAEDLARIAAP